MASKVLLSICLAIACVAAVQGQGEIVPRVCRLALLDQKLAFDITLPSFGDDPFDRKVQDGPPLAFRVALEDPRDSEGYLLLAVETIPKGKEKPNAWLTIRLHPIANPTAEDFRTSHLKSLTKRDVLKTSSVRTWDYNHIPLARYSLLHRYDDGTSFTGPTPRVDSSDRHLSAYFASGGVSALVTMVISDFDADQEKLFYSMLDSAKFVDTSNPTSSFDYYHKGQLLYRHTKYAQAVEPLAGAVILEKRERKLQLREWRDLIYLMANCLARTGRTSVAFEVLQYGIGVDPSNWSFHAELARIYARDNDLEKTLAEMEKTFSLAKAANINRIWLPYPSAEPAFKELMKNTSFREAVKKMEKE